MGCHKLSLAKSIVQFVGCTIRWPSGLSPGKSAHNARMAQLCIAEPAYTNSEIKYGSDGLDRIGRFDQCSSFVASVLQQYMLAFALVVSKIEYDGQLAVLVQGSVTSATADWV